MGDRSNGIVFEREAKIRKRNRNSDDELENGSFRTPITEERYRSMLSEHMQRYKRRLKDSSLSPAPARIPTPVLKSNVAVAPKARKLGNEHRVASREMERTPESWIRPGPLNSGNHYGANYALRYGSDRYTSSPGHTLYLQ